MQSNERYLHNLSDISEYLGGPAGRLRLGYCRHRVAAVSWVHEVDTFRPSAIKAVEFTIDSRECM